MNPEIPSYVGYVYRNKPKPRDSWFSFVAYMCHKIIFGIFEEINRNKSGKDNQPQRTQRSQS